MAPRELSDALAALNELSAFGVPIWKDELDTTALEIHIPLAELPWTLVQSAAVVGLRITMLVEDKATGRLAVETTTGGSFSIDVRGEFDQSLGGAALTQFREACNAADLGALIQVLLDHAEADCRLWATLVNRAAETGCHWIRSRERLLIELSDPMTAVALSRRLAVMSDIRHLVVADATSVLVSTQMLSVHGPGDWPTTPDAEWMDDTARTYAETFQVQWAEQRVPSPLAFSPTSATPQDSELVAAFSKLSELLAWIWISADSRALRFEGVRTLELALSLPEPGNLVGALNLWRWAVSSPAFDRREALQRAVTLSVFKGADLQQTASILKNARWFLDLAQRDAVAEALSTRRQVREAALSTAASVASRASDATSKAFDRVALQIAAAVGIILAQNKSLLDPVSAARLLAAVIGLLIASGLLSTWFDFRYISQSLQAFKHDLQAYRETLSSEDIAAVIALLSLSTAEQQNTRRWKVSILLHAIVIAAILATIVVMLNGNVLRVFP